MTSRLVLPLPGSEAFSARLAAAGGFELGGLEFRRFPDGERYLRIDVDPKGRPVDIVCANADEHFLTLAFAADALRDLGASEVTLVAPYLGYMRQDARFRPGEAVTSRTFARLISCTVDRLITVDPHLHRFACLDELYEIPCVALRAAPLIGEWIAREVANPLIIGPDAESEPWAAEIATKCGAPYAVLSKTRRGDRDVQIAMPDLGLQEGRQPVLIDDIASSGRTLMAASAELRKEGFPAPVCVVVHAIFGGDAFSKASAGALRIVSTDTVAHASNAISVASLIADALALLNHG
ncbi:MAG: ribose-phosphate pyrophosphokinase [Alphaproteobacteria bacterium]|nr:ribose-phosphate pyrophosphokinase [Alphaproteobacteria bacterium]